MNGRTKKEESNGSIKNFNKAHRYTHAQVLTKNERKGKGTNRKNTRKTTNRTRITKRGGIDKGEKTGRSV
jgi:hypothetical protein